MVTPVTNQSIDLDCSLIDNIQCNESIKTYVLSIGIATPRKLIINTRTKEAFKAYTSNMTNKQPDKMYGVLKSLANSIKINPSSLLYGIILTPDREVVYAKLDNKNSNMNTVLKIKKTPEEIRKDYLELVRHFSPLVVKSSDSIQRLSELKVSASLYELYYNLGALTIGDFLRLTSSKDTFKRKLRKYAESLGYGKLAVETKLLYKKVNGMTQENTVELDNLWEITREIRKLIYTVS